MLLKHYLDRGVSKAELSRRFGVNRRTIHNWVDTGQLDQDLAAGARGYVKALRMKRWRENRPSLRLHGLGPRRPQHACTGLGDVETYLNEWHGQEELPRLIEECAQAVSDEASG